MKKETKLKGGIETAINEFIETVTTNNKHINIKSYIAMTPQYLKELQTNSNIEKIIVITNKK